MSLRRFCTTWVPWLVTAGTVLALMACGNSGAPQSAASAPNVPAPPGTAEAWRFDAPVLVTTSGGEPGLAIGPDGTLYVHPLTLVSEVIYASRDGGETWAPLTPANGPLSSNDNHVVVAPDGTIYLVTLQFPFSTCLTLASSADGGKTWRQNPVTCDNPITDNYDRPWLALLPGTTPDAYRLFLYAGSPCCERHVVRVSEDGGTTWGADAEVTLQGGFPGALLAAPDTGHLYAIFSCTAQFNCAIDEAGTRVALGRSTDGGRTWREIRIADLNTADHGLGRAVLARDASGVLYAAWADDVGGSGVQIWLARSGDDGLTWGAPQQVSEAGGTRIFPTLDARQAGEIVIGWHQTDGAAAPNALAADTEWRPRAARSFTAHRGPRIAWDYAKITDKVIHRGPLCTGGASCNNAGNRRLFEFFTVRFDANGRVLATWADDADELPDPGPPHLSAIYFAREAD